MKSATEYRAWEGHGDRAYKKKMPQMRQNNNGGPRHLLF